MPSYKFQGIGLPASKKWGNLDFLRISVFPDVLECGFTLSGKNLWAAIN
jgi:hypothetical protein